jgi:hypothetical protein
MSEETINYLIYDTEPEAITRADTEGLRRQYPYFTQENGVTRYHTYPKLTSNGKYALDVTEYELTEDEQSAITNSVKFPTPEGP